MSLAPIQFVDAPPHLFSFLSVAQGGAGREWMNVPLQQLVCEGLPDGLDALLATSDLQALVLAPDGTQRLAGIEVAEVLAEFGQLGWLPAPERVGVLLAGDLYTVPDLST